MIPFANIICLFEEDMFLFGEDVSSFGNDMFLFGNVMSLFVRVELHCPTGHMCPVILAGGIGNLYGNVKRCASLQIVCFCLQEIRFCYGRLCLYFETKRFCLEMTCVCSKASSSAADSHHVASSGGWTTISMCEVGRFFPQLYLLKHRCIVVRSS